MFIILLLSIEAGSVDRGVEDRATQKSRTVNPTRVKKKKKSSSVQTRLHVLFSASLSLRPVYISHRENRHRDNKTQFIRKWLLCASPAPDPSSTVTMETRHKRQYLCLSERTESPRKPVDQGQSEAARRTEIRRRRLARGSAALLLTFYFCVCADMAFSLFSSLLLLLFL